MAYPSIGNSLTSISSLNTLPPSPLLRARQSEHGPRHPLPPPSIAQPTAREEEENQPIELLRRVGSHSEARSGLGSVPSPRPRFAHLTSSAPTRPRIPRMLSSGSAHIPSPLNPASRKSAAATTAKTIEPKEHMGHINLAGLGGSVPEPRHDGLFTSMLNGAPDIPTSLSKGNTDPSIRRDSGGDGPRREEGGGEVTFSRNTTRQASPIRIARPTAAPADSEDETWRLRSPNSFSTFVELMYLPKPVSLIPIDRRRTSTTASASASAPSETISELVL